MLKLVMSGKSKDVFEAIKDIKEGLPDGGKTKVVDVVEDLLNWPCICSKMEGLYDVEIKISRD